MEVIEDVVVGGDSGTPVLFNNAATSYISATYDSANNKVVVVYKNESGSYYGTAAVGTVNGNSISFGIGVPIASAVMDNFSITFDTSTDRVVVSYSDLSDGSKGKVAVGEVSGTSISFGTPVLIYNGAIYTTSIGFDSSTDRIVVSYSTGTGRCKVGTVTGGATNSISFGTEVVSFGNLSTSVPSSTVFDSTNNRIVIAFHDEDNSDRGTAIVGKVTAIGNVIVFGTKVAFAPAETANISATFDSNTSRVVISYRDYGNSFHGTAVVGEVDNTDDSITFGTPVVFNEDNTFSISSVYNSTSGKVVISYQDVNDSSYGKSIVGTVTGGATNSISFDTAVVYENTSITYSSSTYDSTEDRVIFLYEDTGNSEKGTGISYNSTIATTTNAASTIGISTEAIANAATGTITVLAGINGGHTLVVGAIYYVDYTGAIVPNPNLNYDYERLGKAISATEILLDFKTEV